MAPSNIGDLDGFVDGIVQDVLATAMVERVTTRRGVDHDGDPVLAIDVIVRGELDAARVSRLIEALRSRLTDQGEAAFPLLSFMTPEEAAERAG